MKKFLFAMAGIIFVLVLTQSAYALTWFTSPDGNVSGDPEIGLILGSDDVDKLEGDTQEMGIFGVGTHLVSGFSSHSVSFITAMYSYDSYNALNGYNDVFLMALTEGDYYWNLPITHPVESDAQLIWPSDLTRWGGNDWGDGIESPPGGGGTNVFIVDSSKDYYLNFILDTSNGDDMYPSWGYISDVQLRSTSDIPEPATLLLIGSGLAGLGLWRRKGF